jgi:hypothetical protein
MNSKSKLLSSLLFLFFITNVIAQTPMEEYVKKTGVEKIKKKFVADAFSKPATHKSFKDGHGKTPYLTSTNQLPNTIALITFHINKEASEGYNKIDWLDKTQLEYKQAMKGGNTLANIIEAQTLKSLKEAFAKRGASLLIPKEYLNTEGKINFYYNLFTPEVSKLGKFLSNIENRNLDLSVCATSYRYFDLGAALDYKRSNSLGNDLVKGVGVNGTLSIAIELYTDKKGVSVSRIKMAVHGSNPNPKVDKKYFGQKNGTGYYKGQLYYGATYTFKKPIKIIDLSKKEFKLDGLEIIFSSFIEKYYDEMDVAINKASK